MAKTELFDPAEFSYRVSILKATNKQAKIPTSAILEEEQKYQETTRIIYDDYMAYWPKVHSY